MTLANKYRPRKFEEVVGQHAVSIILQAMIVKKVLHHALLFSGPSGTGKTSMARIIAAALNPDTAEDVHNGSHPWVLEIDAASNGSVAAMRELKKSLNSHVPGHRVVILDEAHSMSSEAYDVMKNMLEFPSPNITYILCTTELHALEPAIRHRCDRYDFVPASIADLIKRINYVVSMEGLQTSEELINLIAQRSEGSYREALMLLDQVSNGNINTVEEYYSLVGEYDIGPLLVEAALYGSASVLNKLAEVLRYVHPTAITDRTVETLRDILLLQAGIDIPGTNLEARKLIAVKTDSTKIVKAISILWDLQTKLSAGDPIRNLEMAFSLIGAILQKHEPVVTAQPEVKPAPVASRVLSLAEMQAKTS